MSMQGHSGCVRGAVCVHFTKALGIREAGRYGVIVCEVPPAHSMISPNPRHHHLQYTMQLGCRCPARGAVRTSATSDRATLNAFTSWAISKKIGFAGLRAETRGLDRGLYATFPVKPSVSVPAKQAITLPPGQPCPDPRCVHERHMQAALAPTNFSLLPCKHTSSLTHTCLNQLMLSPWIPLLHPAVALWRLHH